MKKSKKLELIFDALRQEVENRKTSILQKILYDEIITNPTKQIILGEVKRFTNEDSNHKGKVSKRKHIKLIESIELKFLKHIGVQEVSQDAAEQDVLSVLKGVTLETLPQYVGHDSGSEVTAVEVRDVWAPCVPDSESGWPTIGDHGNSSVANLI